MSDCCSVTVFTNTFWELLPKKKVLPVVNFEVENLYPDRPRRALRIRQKLLPLPDEQAWILADRTHRALELRLRAQVNRAHEVHDVIGLSACVFAIEVVDLDHDAVQREVHNSSHVHRARGRYALYRDAWPGAHVVCHGSRL